MTDPTKDLDLVIFGATGYTGKLVVEEFCRCAQSLPNLTWAISGRSRDKLLEVANIINITTKNNLRQPEILIANVDHQESLAVMAHRAKVVIDCVGPFRLWGEPVVKACIENMADYIDINGEPEYIEQIQFNYHQLAKANNVAVVTACGFDCVPSDIGFLYTKRQLEARGALPSSVEFFLRMYAGPTGFGLHYGTYESLVLSLANIDSLRQLRSKSNRPRVPKIGPELKKIPNGRWEQRVNGYATPFFFADPSVIRLSQQLDIEYQTGVPPVQFSAYIVVPKLRSILEMVVGYKIFSFLAHYSWGRWLLLRYPRLFTFGVFSREGPTLEQIEGTSFATNFYGRGYSKELLNTVLESSETTPLTHNRTLSASFAPLRKIKPDVEIVTQVSGPEPGYATTPIIAVQCAITMLVERSNIPTGVLTTSVAFGKTSLIEKLQDNGISFRVVEGRFAFSA